MTSTRQDGPADDPNEEDVVLVRRGIERLRTAKYAVEQRRALITWLRGATSAVDEHFEPDFGGSPGTVLVAALEDLNNGVTPPLLKAATGGTRQRLALARAKARALAAIKIMLRLQLLNGPRKNVGMAISAVSHLCGMSPKSLRSLRSHVQTGKAYRSVANLLVEEQDHLEDRIGQFELLGLDAYHALVSGLMRDRLLLRGEGAATVSPAK